MIAAMGKRTPSVVVIVGLLAGTVHADSKVEPAPDPWKQVFAASAVATAGLLGFSMYARVRMDDEASQATAMLPGTLDNLTEDDCHRADVIDPGGHFRSACRWESRGSTAMYFGLGFAAITAVTAYLAFVDKPVKRESKIAVTPSVSPDGAGALVEMRW